MPSRAELLNYSTGKCTTTRRGRPKQLWVSHYSLCQLRRDITAEDIHKSIKITQDPKR